MALCSVCGEEKKTTDFYYVPKKKGMCKSCLLKKQKAKWKENYCTSSKKAAADRRLRLRYGLSLDDYDSMVLAQKGVCAICGDPNLKGYRLCIDHNHKTLAVRELLCTRCNTVIGSANEDLNLLDKIKNYIIKHEQKT